MKTRIILISVAVLITFSLKAQEFQQLNVSPLSSIHFNSYPTEFNGKLYFSNGEELWVTDGSQQGTFLLKDINPTGNSKP